ncbi:hypothetical protein ABMA27_011390 [Loxostege sticticalis]|uniref:Retrotransposon gag domain-containing protein n=1 Tax=Loxostege sticticalis TaxID=481309 RepID=A0ABR3IG38_LOXSC
MSTPRDEPTAGPSTAPVSNPGPQTRSQTAEINQQFSEMELNILCKFINKFDGDREKLCPLLNNCRNAISLASPRQQDILLKYIISQLEGRAESACSIKIFENFQQLETFLKSQFGERKHYAALLSELQGCQQANNESVHEFALRIESCLSKLLTEINISIPTKKKGELAGRVAAMHDLATHTFVVGLLPKISTVVRCRDPETLNDAINFAVSEEKIQQTLNSRQNQTHNQGSNQKRFSQPQRSQTFPNTTYRTTNGETSSNSPVCRYCKTPGHTIDKCRKREYNNTRRFPIQSNNRFTNSQSQNSQPQFSQPRRVQFVEHSDEETSYNDQPESQDNSTSSQNNLNC